MHLYSQQPVKMTTSSYPSNAARVEATAETVILLESPLEVLCDDNVPSSHESQDEEDLLGVIIVTRPHRFELSDSVSEAL